MGNVGIILQARMGSQRLPKKEMKYLNNLTILEWCMIRISKVESNNIFIVATTDQKKDDIIEEYCKKYNILCFRGSEDDVLDRYYKCSTIYQLNTIVRLTGDCPLIDPKIIDKMLKIYQNMNIDIIKNTWFSTGFPSGFDVEIFSYELLEEIHTLNKDKQSREHVTKYIYDNYNKYNIVGLCTILHLDSHLSVDTEDDFKTVKEIFKYVKDSNFTYKDIYDIIKTNNISNIKYPQEIIKLNDKIFKKFVWIDLQ